MTTKSAKRYASLSTVVIAVTLLLGGASSKAQGKSADSLIGMPNPASVYCLEKKGKEVKEQTEEGERTICELSDGSKLEEWELYYRDHPEKERTDPLIGVPNPSYRFCEERGGQAIDGHCNLSDGSKVDLWQFFRYHAYYCLVESWENENEQTTESGGVRNVCTLPDGTKIELLYSLQNHKVVP